MANETNKVITLMCERSADVTGLLDADGKVNGVDGLHVVKLPCSGMVQPLMIEAALKQGAAGVVVCGCQIGDCYYREGNKMIRERLLGNRPPSLKKATDRRRVLALWLSRPQKDRFLADANEFMQYLRGLPAAEPAAAAPAKPAPAAVKPAPDAAGGPAATPEDKAAKEQAKTSAAVAADPKAVSAVVGADGKVDNTKTVVPADSDSNQKDPKVVVDIPPIQEGRGPLDSTGDATSST